MVGVDGCLGRVKSVGWFEIGEGGLKGGGGVEKEVGEVGNFDINGMVKVRGFME
ncbi:DUF1256 domain-containing protein [Bacillus altitudinis]|uniref:DUF1256 domain-containing protein n=1 Tax=Bacillus altitudinis TaxID=293387 RepID=UPI003B51F61A